MLRKVLLIALLTLLIIFYNVVPSTMDIAAMVILLGVAIFSTILFFTNKEKQEYLKGQFLKHSNIVILGLLIVHFQLYLDYILGNISKYENFIWANQKAVVKSMTLSTIGLISFYLGYLYFKKPKKVKIKNSNETKYSVKILTYAAALVLAIYFYTVNPLYLAGLYGSEDMGMIATYMALLFYLLIFAIIIQSTRNLRIENKLPANLLEYLKLMNPFLVVIIGIYLLSVLISGDRGPLISFGLSFGSGYFFVKRVKLSFKKGILLIVSGAFVFTFLGLVRSVDKKLSFTEKIQRSFDDDKVNYDNYREINSILPQTKELASSVRTLHHTVNYVPAKHDFLYGRFQFQQITTAIPFFNTFNNLIFDKLSYKYRGSGSFITWIIQGDNPTSGSGTTCIADFYFDFGVPGVIIGMFIFGYFIRMFEINMYGIELPSLLLHTALIIYLSDALYISRSPVLFELRSVVWVFLVLLINKYIINNKIRLA